MTTCAVKTLPYTVHPHIKRQQCWKQSFTIYPV